MRRRISLYIANQLVDLDDDSFILFNYTQEETTNPVIVANSFSQQITLKGTPANNKVFGNIYRFDRVTQYGDSFSGVEFDPTRKTPFVVYNERSEVLESGYIKLDKVKRVNSQLEYVVTLFGGLGSFFYGLSYDENGNKRTLADLDFLKTGTPEEEFDFTIDKTAVLDAWARLDGDTSKDSLWDVLNFAPAYNGLPQGTFDADKAVVNASNAGLITSDGEYSTKNGFVLVNLPKEYTEWEVKDLRSYLQRPVIKMSAIIEAICDPDNNGGYEVNLDDTFFNSANPYYNDLWLTLPVLNTLNLENTQGSGDLVISSNILIPEGGDLSTHYNVDLVIVPEIQLVYGGYYGNLYMHSRYLALHYVNWLEYTATAYDRDGNSLGYKIVRVSTTQSTHPDLPPINFVGTFVNGGMWSGPAVHIRLEATGLHHITLNAVPRGYAYGAPSAQSDPYMVWSNPENFTPNYEVRAYHIIDTGLSKYTYTSSSSARSGALITKKLLLSSDKTPADYLISYCKIFGLQFLCDKVGKRISILTRPNLFSGGVIDITNRIHTNKDIEKTPYNFDAKWYDFGVKYENGEFAQYYKSIYSQPFGLQRVNTGYGFNAESKDVMDSVLFTGAIEVLENSKYFVNIIQNGKNIPSVFIDSAATYNLYNDAGDTQEYSVPIPNASAVKTWLNPTLPMYDAFSKVQLHSSGNEPFEERDSLVFFRGMKSFSSSSRYAVTDDNRDMLNLNDETPCWLLDYQLVDASCRATVMPMFSRYVWDDNSVVRSLDFGIPYEVSIPEVEFNEASSLYAQFWERYIRDRYDDDSSVVTCYVDWAGMQVNEGLFRNFYYFGGAVWSLNRIINHSMTTFDPTLCEFIKVQDIDNYQQ